MLSRSPLVSPPTGKRSEPGSRRGRMRSVLACVALLVGGGCSDSPRSTGPTGVVVRVLDAKPTAMVGYEALVAAAASKAPTTAPFFDQTIETVSPQIAYTTNAPFVAELFAERLEETATAASATQLTTVYLERKRAGTLRFTLIPGPGETPHVFVYHARQSFYPADLVAPGRAENVLRQAKQYMQWLAPEPDRTRQSLVAAIDIEAVGVLVGVVNGPHSRLAVAQEPALNALVRTGGIAALPPYALRIRAGNDWRECVVVPREGTIRFDVDVPADAHQFKLAYTRAFGADPTPLHGRVRLFTPDDESSAAVALTDRYAGWSDLTLDLVEFAGTKTTIEFTVDAAPPSSNSHEQLLCFATPTVLPTTTEPSRPDVVLMSLDTVRWDRTSLADATLNTTPALAALADGGVVFESAFSTASWTLPAHSSVFTGMHPDRTGTSFSYASMPSGATTIAELFRTAGYETIALTGGGFVMPEFGFARGFERYIACDPAYPDPDYASTRGDLPDLAGQARNSRATREQILAHLRGPRSRPLFLFVHTYAAHNYTAPPRVLRELGAQEPAIPNLLQGVSTTRLTRYVSQSPQPPDAPQFMARARFLYDCALRTADEWVGQVAGALTASGRLDRTWITVFSDHGEELFERGEIGHGRFLYDELLHVPLLLRGPGLDRGRAADLVSLVDVMPTLLDLAGVSLPSDAPALDGRSLAPRLRGESLPPRPVYARTNHLDIVRRALRSADEKFIRSEQPGVATLRELFDVRTDRGELRNRADDDAASSAAFDERMERFVGALEASAVGGGQASMSDETRRQLEQLGYLGGDH
ncbi:MAG: sulfatase [Planctomycetes bacterium]|nr:sulfatase [Planctomycetota bacterium]